MSFLDRQQGVMDGAASTARRYGAAIDQWEAHAERLQGRLQAATNQADELAKQRIFALAQVEGQTALVRALKHELARACPNSPLLREDGTRRNIQRAAMAEFLKKHGYSYDPNTTEVQKIAP